MKTWYNYSSIILLCKKLRNLKKVVILWQRNKKSHMHTELLHIGDKFTELFETFPSQVFAQEDLDLLRTLKQKKDHILAYEEAT
jgi:hypothetical protein